MCSTMVLTAGGRVLEFLEAGLQGPGPLAEGWASRQLASPSRRCDGRGRHSLTGALGEMNRASPPEPLAPHSHPHGDSPPSSWGV